MLHQGRNQRKLTSLFKSTSRWRLAAIGIISPIVVTAAALPAAAQEQLLGMSDAQVRGALFETVANPGNCQVTFHPQVGASIVVQVDCNASTSPQNLATVRLFSRMLLNQPWVVTQ